MKTIMALTLLAVSMFGCGIMCEPGTMDCEDNVARMCDINQTWEDWQNCASVGMVCTDADARCSGYSGITCCD